MRSGLLAKLKNSVVEQKPLPDNFFTSALNKYDNIPQLVRTPIGPESYIHASQLEDFCARRAALLDRDNSQPREYVTGGMKIVWAIGRSVETHIRKALLDTLGKENFYGKWSSIDGKESYVGAWRKSDQRIDTYEEVTLYDDKLKVSGNPDLIYINENKEKVPLEVKSMNVKDFKELEAPLEQHARQLYKYSWLLKLNGHNPARYGTIIYACKDYLFSGVYKEFTIDFEDPRYRLIVDESLEQAKKYRVYHVTGDLPEREYCKSLFSKMAKTCPACNACFSND